jgi:formiminotetrahydrofolate cyclodeaminase
VSEQGFTLINAIHIAIVNVFMNELKSKEEKAKTSSDANKEKLEEETDTLMEDIRKLVERKEQVWPEIVRLVLRS